MYGHILQANEWKIKILKQQHKKVLVKKLTSSNNYKTFILRIQNNLKNIRQKILRHQNKVKRDRLTNEKNKNHTNMKTVGHTLEFPSGIYWWTLKNLKNQNFEIIIKKKLLEIPSF